MGVWTVVCTINLFWSYFQFSVVFSFIFPSLPSSTFFLSVYDTEFILFHRVLLSFYDTEFIFLDTEFVLFFICSDLIDFIFIFITFHLSCTARHTDNSRSPAPDIAVPRQALCYLSRSNRGLNNLLQKSHVKIRLYCLVI